MATPTPTPAYQPTDDLDALAAIHQILGDQAAAYWHGDPAQALQDACADWAPTPATAA